ncbi:2OG-Fe(II) oxygenase family protein [Sphingobium sp.]|uniref:2OG-Fe(II) oxygenase family protein n=1 Tax=Sphingobium sp. TaxID=1912891 RepID=UPI000DB455C1|nr:2OG-Fe(II) oxygenase family protein [Sphingobium sp.]PZU68639.1 MAG: isopenicillin N synthase family oxygenase [Sphingobium sp.]
MTQLLPIATFGEHGLLFKDGDGFDRACAYGAFHLKHPNQIDFTPGIDLAQKYYLDPEGSSDDAYRGFRTKSLERSLMGYSQTGSDQDELLQIEAPLWREYLPHDAAQLLWDLNDLSRKVLTELFIRVGARVSDIDRIAGGLSNNEALQYCIFNHFRSAIDEPVGLTAHKDSGFITTLYTIEDGLESLKDGQWVPFDPLPGHFTIVLGHSFEILTANLESPVSASYHRVRATPRRSEGQPDRYTFGVYIGPRWDQDLFQYDHSGELRPLKSFMDFQKEKAAEMAYEFHPRVEAAIG